jgi:hypothetical protein
LRKCEDVAIVDALGQVAGMISGVLGDLSVMV